MGDEYLFFSDCHLDPKRPEASDKLLEFIDQRAASACCLYILGDLFEVWLGDDDPADEYQSIIEALRRRAESTRIYFLAGNRDFLLGEKFARRTAINLLGEAEVLQLGEHRTALIHGDTLCTDDHDYQNFRKMVRAPEWQSRFLAQPLVERRRIAEQLRSESTDAMAHKSDEIMDVNQQAVAFCFESLGVDTIIHGHTHRPAVHEHDSGRRYVLGDWNPGPSYLSWRPTEGFRLQDSRI